MAYTGTDPVDDAIVIYKQEQNKSLKQITKLKSMKYQRESCE